MTASWPLANPPIWEVGLGAVTAEATLLDQYEIADVHREFSESYPRVERQVPLVGIQPYAIAGPVVAQPPIIFHQTSGHDFARWWFVSANGHNLIQIQEDFVSVNWRRTDFRPASEQDYPSYAGLASKLKLTIGKLEEHHRDRGRDMPPPQLLDLAYINHISMVGESGIKLRMAESTSFIKFQDQIPKFNVAMSWIERVPSVVDGVEEIRMLVQLNMLSAHAPTDNEPDRAFPFARLSFNARSQCATWDQFFATGEVAHAHMRQRLVDLTGDLARANWSHDDR